MSSPSFFLPKITIKNFSESSTISTFNAWSPPASGPRVIACTFEDRMSEAAPFTVHIEDQGKTLDAGIIEGVKVICELGTSGASLAGYVSGYVREIEYKFKDTNVREVVLHGYTNPIRYDERYINLLRMAARSGSSANPDLTDSTMRASELFKDLHEDADLRPFGGDWLGFTDMSDVQDMGEILCSIRKPFTTVRSAIESLAESVGGEYGVSYDNKPYFRYATHQHSGVRLQGVKDDTLVLPTSTTGYFVGPWGYRTSIKKSDGFANQLIGKGGTEYVLDINQLTDSSQDEVYTVDRAGQFTPTVARLDGIILILSRVGTLTGDIKGHVVMDKNDKPEGDEVGTFTIFKSLVGTSATKLPRVTLTMSDHRMQVDKKYWVVLDKQGDINNHFRWHHDNGTTGVSSSRSAGVWTTDTTGVKYCIQTFRSYRIVSMLRAPTSTNRYGIIENVLDAPWAMERRAMDLLLASVLRWSAMKKLKFTPNRIWSPTTILKAGQLIQVVEPRANLDINAEILMTRYSFSSNAEGEMIGTNHCDIELVGFQE